MHGRERADSLMGLSAHIPLNNGPQKAPAKIYMTLKGWGWGQEYIFKKKQNKKKHRDGKSDELWHVTKSWEQDGKALEASLWGQHIQHSYFILQGIPEIPHAQFDTFCSPACLNICADAPKIKNKIMGWNWTIWTTDIWWKVKKIQWDVCVDKNLFITYFYNRCTSVSELVVTMTSDLLSALGICTKEKSAHSEKKHQYFDITLKY